MKTRILLLFIIALLLTGCATLMPPSVNMCTSTKDWNYQYIFVTPTSEISSVSGATIGGYYGVYGATTSHSISPADIISGYFINKGYIKVAEIKPEIAGQTIVINYGETSRGYINLSRKVGIVIQLVSADNNGLIGVCKGEGQGETDADAIKNAIDRCLEAFFNQK